MHDSLYKNKGKDGPNAMIDGGIYESEKRMLEAEPLLSELPAVKHSVTPTKSKAAQDGSGAATINFNDSIKSSPP